MSPLSPLLYYDSAQKSLLFSSGAEVKEYHHGPAGSYIFLLTFYTFIEETKIRVIPENLQYNERNKGNKNTQKFDPPPLY
jgi:hypothetical protein